MSRPARIALLTLVTLAVLAPSARAQRQHVIRGTVTSDSGTAIAAADVIVTIAPSAETIVGKSDAAGNYRVIIPAASATGEYLLYIGALGRRPFRQRVAITASADSAVVNVKLVSAVTTVAGVQVNAQRARPTASLGNDIGPMPQADGMNKIVDGVVNNMPPDQQGNFDAMASLIPGVAVTSNGVSAFGLGADANQTTLNGMSFGGSSVPRDLATRTTFFTSPWDPTRGGFSGALASTQVIRGTNVSTRRAHVTLDAPELQTGDHTARAFGQKYTSIDIGSTGSGAFSLDKYFYNYAIQASRRIAPVSSLLALDDDALAHAGIAPDSAARLMQLLSASGIPLTTRSASQRTTTSVQFLERFDRALPVVQGVTPAPAWNLLVGADYSRSDATALTPTLFPASAGRAENGGGVIQGMYSRYFGKYGDYVNETASGFSYRDNRGSPYTALPSGNVLVASSIDGATPTIGSLAFGGNSLLSRDNRTWAWELNNQTDFLINDHQSLPAKLYFQSRYEHYDLTTPANRLGSFTFASLGDLASNTPSTFSRTLDAPSPSGGEWLGAVAAGASYTSTHLVVSGGARIDANEFTGVPTYDAAIDSTFHIRNDRAPNSIAVSPRVGFTWYPTGERGLYTYNIGGGNTLRGGYQVRGGIGEFRNFLPSTLLSNAIGATGLPGSADQLTCFGTAAPIPDWQTYLDNPSTIPTTCAGGSSVLTDVAPGVNIIDPSFQPSRSWRATLGWSNGGTIGSLWNNYVTIDGVYALNLDQPGTFDLNFGGMPGFTMPAEGNRPVYVSPSSIVAATGAVSPVQSRVSTSFGRVADRLSDLRSDVRQITFYGIPNIPFKLGLVTLGYTYSDARAQARGFDGGSAADPRRVEWGPQPFTPRHQFIIQGAWVFPHGVTLSSVTRVMSGLRYTPTVLGDVNGDGWSGDRAYVFSPTTAPDTGVAHGMQNLLATGSSSARACLARQLNTIAGRASCIGPWTATMNASLTIQSLGGRNNRVQPSIYFSNPLGGLDQLLHRSSGLRGWGSVPVIDGTLYQVRGFDPTAKQFLYRVNPRFGSSTPSLSTLRAPFRVTLDVRIDYGRSVAEQRLDLNLRIQPPLVGTRATFDTIRARYVTSVTDPYQVLLAFADSVALTRAQAEALQAQDRVFTPREVSVYDDLARYLVGLPSNYDVTEAVRHVNDANDAAWNIVYGEAPFFRKLLTSGQIRRLPLGLREMVMSDGYKGRFFYGARGQLRMGGG
jgi:hypothetical protein